MQDKVWENSDEYLRFINRRISFKKKIYPLLHELFYLSREDLSIRYFQLLNQGDKRTEP